MGIGRQTNGAYPIKGYLNEMLAVLVAFVVVFYLFMDNLDPKWRKESIV